MRRILHFYSAVRIWRLGYFKPFYSSRYFICIHRFIINSYPSHHRTFYLILIAETPTFPLYFHPKSFHQTFFLRFSSFLILSKAYIVSSFPASKVTQKEPNDRPDIKQNSRRLPCHHWIRLLLYIFEIKLGAPGKNKKIKKNPPKKKRKKSETRKSTTASSQATFIEKEII